MTDLTEIAFSVFWNYLHISSQETSFAFSGSLFNVKVLHFYWNPLLFHTLLIVLIIEQKYQTVSVLLQKTTESKSSTCKFQVTSLFL